MDNEDEDEDVRLDVNLLMAKLEKKILNGFWLHDDKDVDLRIARLDYLINRRPELANSVLLRQNPHNVEQWHRRVKLFEGDPKKQILTYIEAVRTIDPMKAVGKPHTLWVNFARLYEKHSDLVNARVIFEALIYRHMYFSKENLNQYIVPCWLDLGIGNSVLSILRIPSLTNEVSVHLWQGDEDKLVDVESQRFIAKKLPWIQYHELPGAGHFFPYAVGMSQVIIKTLLFGKKQQNFDAELTEC